MKRIWLVLLSLGLIAAFSSSAMAVDVKIAGQYYAAGMYLDKTTLHKKTSAIPGIATSVPPFVGSTVAAGPNTAFYYQRLRVGAEIIVSPGLKLITRADIMERAWGAARSQPLPTSRVIDGTGALQTFNNYPQSAGTNAENENIAFDLAYISYLSPIGLFNVGYMLDHVWGTVFGDSSVPTGRIVYGIKLGGWTSAILWGKESQMNYALRFAGEQSYPRGQNIVTALSSPDLNTMSDSDSDFYCWANYYSWKNAEAGLLLRYNRIAAVRALSIPLPGSNYHKSTANSYIAIPYFKAKVGPVDLEGEIDHIFGQYKHDEAGYADTRIEVLNVYLNAQADLDKFYVGGTLAYLSGQDPGTDAIKKAGLDGGFDWNPCLIMWNTERTQWAGSLNGYTANKDLMSNATSTFDATMSNAWFFQVRGGIRPVEKLDIGMSVSYANAVVKPTNDWLYNDYGWEVDLTGTYKITNNLSYMVGGAYLFTGKYFKANSDSNEVQDDYLLLNKLTLTF
jgi:hypothetical protein